ncbi:hypothetical protein [Cellulomonas sp. NPDC089187]|uniref:WXG100 family type VII secretion target n=1 Tax=Cellulomonas sp. NPDC089187 TaxID=3154970 RepID=UPI003439FA32
MMTTYTPTEALAPPVADMPIPQIVDNIAGFGQYISFGHWVVCAIDAVFDVNPFQQVAEWMGGDWSNVMLVSDALDKLAEYADRLGGELTLNTKSARADWDGNAANAMEDYFTGLSDAINSLRHSLTDCANQFRAVAAGMQESVNAIVGYFESLIDALIAFGLSLAATALTSWTGVGAVAGTVATGAAAASALAVFADIVSVWNASVALTQGAVGVIAGCLGAVRGFESVSFPAAYSHPGVA